MKKILIAICLISCSTFAFASYNYTIVNAHKYEITCNAWNSNGSNSYGAITIAGNARGTLIVNSPDLGFYIDCISHSPVWIQSLFPTDGNVSPMPGDGLTLKFSYGPGKFDSSLIQI